MVHMREIGVGAALACKADKIYGLGYEGLEGHKTDKIFRTYIVYDWQ